MNKISIIDMPEDLLDENRSDQTSSPKKPTSENWTGKGNSSETPLNQDNFIADVAKALEITKEELRDWVQEAVIPKDLLKTILRIAKRLKLNPLIGQIDWEQNPEGSYEIYIPIDGWITLIHREPNFKGLTFHQSPETDQGVPIWMECSIYRSDLIQPIAVREYYVELKTEHPMWQQMPRRMLRHKTLQQSVRLAFGISVPELKPIKHNAAITKKENVTKGNRSQTSKQILKEKLAQTPQLAEFKNF
jgi:hypothetical protein